MIAYYDQQDRSPTPCHIARIAVSLRLCNFDLNSYQHFNRPPHRTTRKIPMTEQTQPPVKKKSSIVKPLSIGCGGLLLLFIIVAIVVAPDKGKRVTTPTTDDSVATAASPVDSSSERQEETAIPPEPQQTSEPDANLGPHSRLLRKSDFGDEWPLSVEQGVVECRDGAAVLFHAGGKTYPVNGTAKGWYKELPSIEEIWLENPSLPGTRINISPIIEAGRKLCN
jgi:Protein of unknown function (DUF2511)